MDNIVIVFGHGEEAAAAPCCAENEKGLFKHASSTN